MLPRRLHRLDALLAKSSNKIRSLVCFNWNADGKSAGLVFSAIFQLFSLSPSLSLSLSLCLSLSLNLLQLLHYNRSLAKQLSVVALISFHHFANVIGMHSLSSFPSTVNVSTVQARFQSNSETIRIHCAFTMNLRQEHFHNDNNGLKLVSATLY